MAQSPTDVAHRPVAPVRVGALATAPPDLENTSSVNRWARSLLVWAMDVRSSVRRLNEDLLRVQQEAADSRWQNPAASEELRRGNAAINVAIVRHTGYYGLAGHGRSMIYSGTLSQEADRQGFEPEVARRISTEHLLKGLAELVIWDVPSTYWGPADPDFRQDVHRDIASLLQWAAPDERSALTESRLLSELQKRESSQAMAGRYEQLRAQGHRVADALAGSYRLLTQPVQPSTLRSLAQRSERRAADFAALLERSGSAGREGASAHLKLAELRSRWAEQTAPLLQPEALAGQPTLRLIALLDSSDAHARIGAAAAERLHVLCGAELGRRQPEGMSSYIDARARGASSADALRAAAGAFNDRTARYAVQPSAGRTEARLIVNRAVVGTGADRRTAPVAEVLPTERLTVVRFTEPRTTSAPVPRVTHDGRHLRPGAQSR